MLNLSQLSEIEVDKALSVIETGLEQYPKARVSFYQSARYITTEFIKTIRSNRVHDDYYLVVELHV